MKFYNELFLFRWSSFHKLQILPVAPNFLELFQKNRFKINVQNQKGTFHEPVRKTQKVEIILKQNSSPACVGKIHLQPMDFHVSSPAQAEDSSCPSLD